MTKFVPVMALCSPPWLSERELTTREEWDQPVGLQLMVSTPSTIPVSPTTEGLKVRNRWPKTHEGVLEELAGVKGFKPDLGQ